MIEEQEAERSFAGDRLALTVSKVREAASQPAPLLEDGAGVGSPGFVRLLEMARSSLGADAAVLCLAAGPGRMQLQHAVPSLTAITWRRFQHLLQSAPLPLHGPMPDAAEEEGRALPPGFCLAVRVRGADGAEHGLLAVLDETAKPRPVLGDELRRLEAIAELLGEELELRRELAEAQQVAAALKTRYERLRQDQEVLVKAIDHRIRNGLQMVNDMLSLQAQALGDTAAAARLDAAAGRVQAVAEAHAHLQRRPAAGQVSARDYVALLLRRLRQCWPDPDRTLRLRPAPDVMVSALDAPRIGIIAWELLANALRHGRGHVEIVLRPVPETGQLRIVVRDEGPGPDPHTIAAASARGTQKSGLGLIRLIAGGHAAGLEPGLRPGIGITISLRRPAG